MEVQIDSSWLPFLKIQRVSKTEGWYPLNDGLLTPRLGTTVHEYNSEVLL